MKRIASIDVGSNTLRLLILETDGAGNFRELAADRAITRLGEGMDSHRRLLDRRIEATLEALARFRDKCRAFGDMPIHAVATSAVREASNQEEFLRRVYDETGITLEVIPWEEEARLTLDGVFWKIPGTGDVSLTFDIGGGSTEFILSKGKDLLASAGTSLGIVRLTEKFISRHPTAEDEYRALQTFVRRELQSVRERLAGPAARWPATAPERDGPAPIALDRAHSPSGSSPLGPAARWKPRLLIGTAGTVTTLAALDKNIYPYDPLKVHGSVLTRRRIQEILDDLKTKTLEERLLLKPLERGREDVIVAGICIVLETLDAFGIETLTVSEYSLREGILLKALAREG